MIEELQNIWQILTKRESGLENVTSFFISHRR